MTRTNSRGRRGVRTAVALAAAGAGAAGVLGLTATAASASPLNGLTVEPGLSIGMGTQYGTSCSYKTTVRTGSTATVNFDYRKTDQLNWTPFDVQSTTGPGTAVTHWTPAFGPGTYEVRATSGNTTEVFTTDVGIGINLGSACVVLGPFQ
ncbi:hypothetical protein [Tomitella fengzijianii]|uniref:Ig-like domain-containing protein n=1 Tax=Tomitella fengzijianii TaxID=2597660 RepID=A0A516X5N0_9ACTN|nr:hypothetical protein [Tomitella fengzijianii]QDQ98377.1 hypothetical protein FO059_14935 [Tomitella fengzijianii]